MIARDQLPETIQRRNFYIIEPAPGGHLLTVRRGDRITVELIEGTAAEAWRATDRLRCDGLVGFIHHP